jgi:probable rRNA maturation factor
MTQRMILLSTNHPHLRFSSGEVLRVLRCVYQSEGMELPPLAIVFTHNRFIRKMNREFLGHDFVTDVLAFPLGDDGGVEGEIYINLDAARKQAMKYFITYTQETRQLLIHGALHLIGYDDTTPRKKKKMIEREEMYLEILRKKRTR